MFTTAGQVHSRFGAVRSRASCAWWTITCQRIVRTGTSEPGFTSRRPSMTLRAGWRVLRDRERRRSTALGDVSGLSVVHLQCHIGLDTLHVPSTNSCATTAATRPSRPSTVSVTRSRRSSSARSATSTDSAHPKRCAPGPGSLRVTASLTPRSCAARSPHKDRNSCAGPHWKRSSAPTAAHHYASTSIGSRNDGAPTRRASRPPVDS